VKSLQAQISFSQPLMLCVTLYYICINCICKNTWHNCINCLDQDKAFSKGKTSQIRVGKAKVFLSDMAIKETLVFIILYLDFVVRRQPQLQT